MSRPVGRLHWQQLSGKRIGVSPSALGVGVGEVIIMDVSSDCGSFYTSINLLASLVVKSKRILNQQREGGSGSSTLSYPMKPEAYV